MSKEGFANLKYLESLFEPILVTNNNLELLYYNNYFATFTKSSPRVLRKVQQISDILDFESNILNTLIKKSIDENATLVSEELPLKIKGNDTIAYTVVIKVIPLEDFEGHCLVCFNDISVETQLYEKYRAQLNELKESHDQILQTDKLATLGQLSAGISHEINNPLTIAFGNAQNIEFYLEEDQKPEDKIAEIEECNNRVISSLERITTIIANMKSFVHKPEGKNEYCDMADTILSAIDLVHTGSAKNKVDITTDFPQESIICLVNKIEIEQVLVNLIKNSIDALMDSILDDPKITVSLVKNNDKNCIELIVKDNGPGIPEEIQEKIFTPFFTTKKVGKGTGLGMAISKKLVEKHQGEIFIRESNKNGTSFVLQLPMIEMSSYTMGDQFLTNLTNDENLKILVVDDEPQILNVLDNFLKDEGHIFIGSSGGDEALDILKKIDVDIIITDFNMPNMNGTEFSTLIREINEDIPILYLSSADTIEQFKKDQQTLKIAGLIIKPFSKEDIISAISQVTGESK